MTTTDCLSCSNMPAGLYCLSHTCLDCGHNHTPDTDCIED